MAIIIDIPMPKKCGECPFLDGENGLCDISWNYKSQFGDIRVNWDDRPISCPLKELKED